MANPLGCISFFHGSADKLAPTNNKSVEPGYFQTKKNSASPLTALAELEEKLPFDPSAIGFVVLEIPLFDLKPMA
jgi:hypothetical protein